MRSRSSSPAARPSRSSQMPRASCAALSCSAPRAARAVRRRDRGAQGRLDDRAAAHLRRQPRQQPSRHPGDGRGGRRRGQGAPGGQPADGLVARDALHQVKVPLVLVRGNPTRAPSKSDVASSAGGSVRGDGGRRRRARAPMTVAVCRRRQRLRPRLRRKTRKRQSIHRSSFRLRRTDDDAHPAVSTHRTGRHSVLPARRRPRRSPRCRC